MSKSKHNDVASTMVQRELATVPLSLLVSSPKNVRRTVRNNAVQTIRELADSIESQSVLQSLVVSEQIKGGKPTGKYQVDAGRRRHHALKLLLQEKRISAEFEVPVSIGPADSATVASLIENTHREAMHPADEFAAFQALIDEGKSVSDIAHTLGYSELTVKRRLKLAAISPRLMQLYRKDEIGLDQLMALTLTEDHAEQERAWDEAPSWGRSADQLRQTLTHDEIDAARNPVARYVGVDAYIAAGGPVRRDLFRDEADSYLLDSALLYRLATEKLEAAAQEVRAEGWAWVEVHATYDTYSIHDFSRAPRDEREPTKKEQAAIDRLDKRLAELQEAYDEQEGGDDENAQGKLDEEYSVIESKREELVEALQVWSDETKGIAGSIVTVGGSGAIEIHRGLIRAEDRKQFTQQRAKVNGEDHELGEKKPPKGEFSESLVRNLTAHRTAAMQAMLAQNPDVALVATVHRFALEAFYAYDYADGLNAHTLSALQVTVTHSEHKVKNAAPEIEQTRAGLAFATLRTEWEAKLPKEATALFDWLREQEHEVLLSLLAFCAASTIDTIAHDTTAAAKAMSAVAEAVSETAAAELTKLKKDALVDSAARKVAGTGWLPSVLR